MTQPKYLVKLIESIINTELSEVAVSPEAAASQEMALLVHKHKNMEDFILYKLNPIKIFGMITTKYKQACAANEIVKSAAEQGYGPLMYHATMSVGSRPYVMADRFMVSDEAANVWRKFASRQDVEKVVLPKDCQFVQVDPEYRFLNFKFALKSPMDFSKLIQAHEANMKNANLFEKTPEELYDIIHEKGLMFFSLKYKD